MRIALDATYSVNLHPSGIAIYSREILEGLSKCHPEDQFLHCYRAKQLRSAPKPALLNTRNRILQPPFRTFRADLFHALNQRVDRRPAKKVISTFHDLFVITGEYSSPEFRTRFAEQARRAADNSDRIIAVSEFTARQVSQLLNVEAARVRVIRHGVHQPARVADQTRERMVLFVGALQVRKNVARLIEAFEAMPSDWRLVLAGSAGGYGSATILARVDASRCRERIEVAGYVSEAELDSLYRRAAIFAFPSLDEGFGIPVLEAMAYGVPVLTSKTSALGEIAGSAAVLVNPGDTKELVDGLRNLATDATLREDLQRRGHEHVKQYTWEKATQETYAVYKELISAA